MPTPVLIVTGVATNTTIAFADAAQRFTPEPILVVADNATPLRPIHADLIHVEDADARQAGCFASSPLIPKTPIAWDKALYLLMAGRIAFDHVWIVEDDVGFSSPELVGRLIERHRGSAADLIARTFFRQADNPAWEHWGEAERFAPHERAGGFLPMVRLSRRMIEMAALYKDQHGSFSFIEAMFPSLAVRHDLAVEMLSYISERRFRYTPSFAKWEILQKVGDGLETGVFHPVKSEALREIMQAKRLALREPSSWDCAFYKLVGPAMETNFARRLTRKASRLLA